MVDIFISYAGEDRATAAALSHALETSGYSVWWDRHLVAGDEFASLIERELDSARCVIVLWSRAASMSRWVAAEGQRAFDADKVVPVTLDDLAPPLPLSMIQAPSLADWDLTSGHPALEEVRGAIVNRIDPSRLIATAPGPLFRCVALGEWGIAAGGHDGSVRVWSLSDGRILSEYLGHGDIATAVAWDGGSLLASGSADRTARLWSLDDGQEVFTLTGHSGPVDDLTFAGESLLSVSADQTLRRWSVDSGEPIGSTLLDEPLLSCSADATGRMIAVGGIGGTVTIILEGSNDKTVVAAHDGAVYSMELSADGRRLLTTGADGLARVWDASTATMTLTLRGHRGPVLAGAIGADAIVTGSSDGTIVFWDAEYGTQLEQIGGLTGGAVGIDLMESGTLVATSGAGQLRARPSR